MFRDLFLIPHSPMRTAEEIDSDCGIAFTQNDAEALLRYAEEFETLGTRFADGEALRCRARAARCVGSTDEAIANYRAALKVYEEVGDLGRVGVMYRDIGQVLSTKGDVLAALDQFKRALEIFERADLPIGVAGMLGSLGNVYRDLGDVSNAMDHYQRALARAIELDRPDQIGMWTGAIASVYRSIGEYPQSVRYYLRAIEIATAAHELENVALLHNNVRSWRFARGTDSFREVVGPIHGDQLPARHCSRQC
jgi:tetratricopeptide (TPR) repeat protein